MNKLTIGFGEWSDKFDSFRAIHARYRFSLYEPLEDMLWPENERYVGFDAREVSWTSVDINTGLQSFIKRSVPEKVKDSPAIYVAQRPEVPEGHLLLGWRQGDEHSWVAGNNKVTYADVDRLYRKLKMELSSAQAQEIEEE